MQEAFMSAFKKLDQFSGQVTFGAWLKKIVINKAIVAFRKQKKQDTIGLVEEIYTISGPLADATHQTNNEKKAALVLETIARLKENYRISLTLHLIEGLTHKEVSELLGISSSNCRTTFSRAKQQLRNQLETHPLWKKL
jgi:RNA polymerase sigma-70 factor (ECF subfamily)